MLSEASEFILFKTNNRRFLAALGMTRDGQFFYSFWWRESDDDEY